MAVCLPEKATVRPDKATVQKIHDELTSVIAGHPQAQTTYYFYEVLDAWLGPWGSEGYPIGYGKFYNIAFTTNKKLMANPTTKEWVWKTTILLQEALRDNIVHWARRGVLPQVTEPDVRNAAFKSHPTAYTRGGLATVVLAAPELIPFIAVIPAAEYNPTSKHFGATVAQVFITLTQILPHLIGNGLAAAAGPAHNGGLRGSFLRDRQRFLAQQNVGRALGRIKDAVLAGDMDHIPWLDRIIAKLNATEFPSQGLARFAHEVVRAAEDRKRMLQEKYARMVAEAPEVQERVRRKFPGVVKPGGQKARR
jgi:hypothetical protein